MASIFPQLNILSSDKPPPPNPTPTSPTKQIPSSTTADIGSRWKEMIGENNWKGLLDPLDPLLRLELLKYGEFSVCTHEAIIKDTYAKNYGVCKFEIFDFFDDVMMPKQGYDVTKFIYCTSHHLWWPPYIPKPNNPRTWQQANVWIGFIAVSNDDTSKKLGRRDVCVTWRGTTTGVEWGNNFRAYLSPLPADDYIPKPDPNVKVEDGFLSLYTHKDNEDFSARELVLSEIRRLVNQVYPDEQLSITVTGHSLGGALALLSAYDILETRVNVRTGGNGDAVPVCAITYAGPRVGNTKFKERVEKLGLKVLRIVCVQDKVPKVPGVAANENLPSGILKIADALNYPFVFTHVGELLELNCDDSPFLKQPATAPHDLDAYLHLIDGYQGKGKEFKSATGRDIALINKESDFLLEELGVPPEWRVDQNKAMVLSKDGFWVHKSTINYFVDQRT